MYEEMNSTLTEKLYSKVKQNNIPFDIMFELTRRCNLKCCHCYVVQDKESQELTLDEITRIIDEVKKAGCLFLTLTGGEPFIREDFFEIAHYVREKGLALQIYTNGTLITPAVADELQKLHLLRVGVSLYGASEKVHESITRIPGSYKKTISAIKFLTEREIPTNIKCTLMKENIEEENQLLHLARSSGVAIHIDSIIAPKDDGDSVPITHRLSGEEIVKVNVGQGFSLAKKRESKPKGLPYKRQKNNVGQGFSLAKEEEEIADFICDAGKTVCSISAYGDVYPCLQLPIKTGNLRENTFQEIWESSAELLRIRKLELKDLQVCSRCDIRDYCNRCPGLAFLEDNDLFGPSKIACTIAKIRSVKSNRSGLLTRLRIRSQNERE